MGNCALFTTYRYTIHTAPMRKARLYIYIYIYIYPKYHNIFVSFTISLLHTRSTNIKLLTSIVKTWFRAISEQPLQLHVMNLFKWLTDNYRNQKNYDESDHHSIANGCITVFVVCIWKWRGCTSTSRLLWHFIGRYEIRASRLFRLIIISQLSHPSS